MGMDGRPGISGDDKESKVAQSIQERAKLLRANDTWHINDENKG